MGHALYVEQETVPFAEQGKEIMFVFREHGLVNAPPAVYITALENNCEVVLKSGIGADTDSYTPTTTISFDHKGQKERELLPVSATLTDTVSVLEVTRGKVAVSIASPTRVKTEFRTRKHP